MPRLSTAARSLLSSLESSSPHSQSSSPAPSSHSLRLLAEALAQSDQSNQDSSEVNLTEEERNNLLRVQFDEEDDEEDEEENETGKLVQSIFKAHIVDKTRKGYHRQQIQLACWIFKQSKDQARPHERARYRSLQYMNIFVYILQCWFNVL